MVRFKLKGILSVMFSLKINLNPDNAQNQTLVITENTLMLTPILNLTLNLTQS